ncbi:hypothetical protein [Mesonia sp. K4-1]|uniref:hypothetical protein n=1 Tax=Mesonia sp. K4-1 TaxID=2602760 RepID=UPI0011C93D42|nr:hypothetical protein [Mesonia sp. K4-1]TXK78694.1 hypothetical protein FT986_02555 [Mesonia sp. K4-1]
MIKDILNGWKNYVVPDAIIDQEAEVRAEICASCPFAKKGKFSAMLRDYKFHEIEGHYCGKCKCPLSPKVRSKNEKCPLNKW